MLAIDFRAKIITRDKEDHFRIIKRLIHKEDITIPDINASNSLKISNNL